MNSSQQFLARLALQYPIIQAPMAGVSTPRMAAAVSNAGGLGSVGLGASNAAQARQTLEELRGLSDRAVNANVFCHVPAQRDADREAAWLRHLQPLFAEAGIAAPSSLSEIYKSFNDDEDMFRMLLELRPAVVSFHFGLPSSERLAALHQAGVFTMATATNLREALAIEAAGVNAIVAQGIEAGGHRGMFDPEEADECLSTSVLVRLLVKKTGLPVVAAGGIMDGAGIKAALDLGAVAAQLGTAFILSPESSASSAYRANMRSARAETTRMTAAISGRPARGIVNRIIAHGAAHGAPPPAAYPVAYDAAKQLHAAAAKSDNHEFAPHWAGQGAPLAREMPAAELLRQLARWRYKRKRRPMAAVAYL
jgi:nitronate monooxygenase